MLGLMSRNYYRTVGIFGYKQLQSTYCCVLSALHQIATLLFTEYYILASCAIQNHLLICGKDIKLYRILYVEIKCQLDATDDIYCRFYLK